MDRWALGGALSGNAGAARPSRRLHAPRGGAAVGAVHGQTGESRDAAPVGPGRHAGENDAGAGGGDPERDPAVWTVSAEGEGDCGALEDPRGNARRCGAAKFRGVGGVAGCGA